MLAVKATYENGEIKWAKRPNIGGRHELIVVFEDVDSQSEVHSAFGIAPQKSTVSWRGFENLIGCVAERADGAERHDDYLVGKDKP